MTARAKPTATGKAAAGKKAAAARKKTAVKKTADKKTADKKTKAKKAEEPEKDGETDEGCALQAEKNLCAQSGGTWTDCGSGCGFGLWWRRWSTSFPRGKSDYCACGSASSGCGCVQGPREASRTPRQTRCPQWCTPSPK